MAEEVLLSICIPTYNRADIVFDCVKKCLEAPYEWIEVVVSDNCSPDNTMQKLSTIDDKRFHLYRNETNIMAGNLPGVLKKGTGKFCMLLSDEDEVVWKDGIEVKNQLINGTNVGVFQCDYFAENGNTARRPQYLHKQNELETYIKVLHRFYYCSGLIFNRKIFHEQYEKMYKQINIWKLYPQKIIPFYCVREGHYAPLLGIECRDAKRDTGKETFSDTKSWGEEPFYTVDGRLKQSEGFIDFFLHFPLDETVRWKLLEEVLFQYLRLFKKYYSLLIFHPEAEVFRKRPDIAERDRSRSDEEWQIKLKENYEVLVNLIRLYKGSEQKEDDLVYESAFKEAAAELVRINECKS